MTETKPKWTPGPWILGSTHWGHFDIFAPDDGTAKKLLNGKPVRDVVPTCGMKYEDARLIAAAPTMAEALAELCALDERMTAGDVIPGHEWNMCFDAARSALRKATEKDGK